MMLRWTTLLLAAAGLLSLTAPTFAETAADNSVLTEVRSRLSAAAPSSDERDRKDREALIAFYAARHGSGLWISGTCHLLNWELYSSSDKISKLQCLECSAIYSKHKPLHHSKFQSFEDSSYHAQHNSAC